MSIIGGNFPTVPGMRSAVVRVLVRFRPDVRLPHSDAAEAEHAKSHGDAWQSLRAKFPGVALTPYFATISAATLQSVEQRAIAAGTPLRLASYFAVIIPDGIDAEGVAQAVAAWPHVELAYVDTGPVVPPVHAADDPLSPNQGYLYAAPAGIDASYAWASTDGSGISLVDLEQGWTLDHEDLPASIPVIGSGVFDPWWANHGTAVLGIVAAVDNARGIVGIAPHASIRVVSQWFDLPGAPPNAYYYNTASAIVSAIAQMKAGDVLLIETTAAIAPKFGWVPAEVDPLVFDLIKATTSMGITVLEPAGNNAGIPDPTYNVGCNLDAFTDSAGKFVLNRATSDFKDSGAIMVASATSAVPHQRMWFANYGSRVDCYAWGEDITTCGGFGFKGAIGDTPQNAYIKNFGGASGATAIVAGAAVLLQSWAAKHRGAVLDTSTLRALLSDHTLNTCSSVPANDRIGVMPDLRRIIDHLSYRDFNRWNAIFAILFGGVIYDGGGWSWIPGSAPKPVPPRVDRIGPTGLAPERRDVLVGLAMLELAGLISDPARRKTVERSIATSLREATGKIETEIKKR